MTDERIRTYLHEVQAFLQVPKEQRSRILDELESHIRDSAAAYERAGDGHQHAVSRAIDELGPPDTVATAFAAAPVPMRRITGAVRWLPMVLPLLMLTAAIGWLLWSLTLFTDGLTSGERVLLWSYIRQGAIAAILSTAAFLAIRRADADRSWRLAAWACTGFALLVLIAGW